MIVTKDRQSLTTALERLSDARAPSRNDLASILTDPRLSWDLNAGFTGAQRMAAEGWREKADELWRQVQALAVKIDAGVKESFDVSGEAVDVGRYLSNEPECMFAQQITPLSSVAIIVNIAARCDADAQCIYNRGIAIAAVIHALQASGRGVSLAIMEAVDDHRGNLHLTEITLQEFGEYINPGRLAFWVAHPAALRRCLFRYNEQQDAEVRERFSFYEGGGYGKPTNVPQEHIPESVVHFPYIETHELHTKYRDPQTALAAVVEEFKKKGVPIEISA